jgi:anti-sigma28 factor (negative regulator of flagellin synthesis)
MKVNGKGDAAEINLSNLRVEQSTSEQGTAHRILNDGVRAEEEKILAEDSVSVNLAAAVSILSPETMVAERRARVEELKRLVAEGRYKGPTNEQLAEKIVEEIELELRFS